MNGQVKHKDTLDIEGARVHNLKNVSLSIPRNQLVVFTGLSGSGKSSLAFDTIYAEGQRRYIESFAAYARQFLGTIERPDVDKIEGLSPVIAIEQKTVNKNPRSTVGTVTEVYDFLRLLYAKVADAFSYVTNEKMVRFSEKQIIDLILKDYNHEKITLLAPLVKGRKGHYRELFNQIRKLGFSKCRIDGELIEITPKFQLDRYKVHDIEAVIDRLKIDTEDIDRLTQSVRTALKHSKGVLMVQQYENEEVRYFSKNLMCPTSGISYDDPAPNSFSFNSPYGACPHCNGLGEVPEISIDKIIPDKNKNIYNGALAPLGSYKNNWIYTQIELIGKKYDFTLKTPFKDISEEAVNIILYGTNEPIKIPGSEYGMHSGGFSFEGIINFITRQYEENPSTHISRWASSFMNKVPCPECKGQRLKKESLYFKIDNRNIAEVAEMDLQQLYEWISTLPKTLSDKQRNIGNEIIKEIKIRLTFILDVGLHYLALNRPSRSLSGGEAQRIRLATQIGSQLVNVLYILDEPSIGLHQRDNDKLTQSLIKLKNAGNSVIVVEHDKDIMLSSDYIVDIGPKAGVQGGKIVGQGKPEEFIKLDTLTAKYLRGEKVIPIPDKRREGSGKKLVLKGATGNNLKNIDLEIPLGKIVCITGVSGSGKSSLIHQTLYPILSKHLYRSVKNALPYKKIEGLDNIDKVIEIDQTPIGRTPRSNPATYSGVFSDIRNLFAQLPEAKIRGYKPGRFSFNVKQGRCETCQGAGVQTIEMNFLPDVYVECPECHGKRYNRETLEVRYKGKSINDVLNMEVEEAVGFFENIPNIYHKIKTLQDVGLNYIKLGQPSTTLSGGEAQRVKLAAELSKKATGNTLYILDEPTTGLHFEDINVLLGVLNKLADLGNTILIIEHNLDVIKTADYIIDLGPEGGKKGGKIIFSGTPEELIKKAKNNYTAHYLKKEFEVNKVLTV